MAIEILALSFFMLVCEFLGKHIILQASTPKKVLIMWDSRFVTYNPIESYNVIDIQGKHRRVLNYQS